MIGGRIQSLENFYSSVEYAVKSISLDELPRGKKITDDMKGQWALEQIENAARTLMVMDFITPLKDGGSEIPRLESLDHYLKEELQPEAQRLERLKASLPFKLSRYEQAENALHAVMERNEARKMKKMSPPKEDKKSNRKASKRGQQESEQMQNDDRGADEDKGAGEASDDSQDEFVQVYETWQQAEKTYSEAEDKVASIVTAASRKAAERFNRDSDALKMLQRATAALRNFVGQLFSKFEKLEEVVRTMDDNDTDPYDKGDMRGVYANVLKKFRGRDQLGVVATIVAAIKEQQSGRSLAQWIRYVETFLIQMRRLKVHEVSMGDLAALIAIAGLTESHRKEFSRTRACCSWPWVHTWMRMTY